MLFIVKSWQTFEESNEIDAAIRFRIDKLIVIKHELATLDENWSEWNFNKFIEVWGKWSINNPVLVGSKVRKERMQALNSRNYDEMSIRVCCYCKIKNHKGNGCNKVKDVGKRKKIIAAKNSALTALVPDTGHQRESHQLLQL